MYTNVQEFGVSKIFFFQGCIKLIKSYTKDIYYKLHFKIYYSRQQLFYIVIIFHNITVTKKEKKVLPTPNLWMVVYLSCTVWSKNLKMCYLFPFKPGNEQNILGFWKI